MTNKELLIDFINYAKARHVITILDSHIDPLVEDYLNGKNVNGEIIHLYCAGRVTACGVPIVIQFIKADFGIQIDNPRNSSDPRIVNCPMCLKAPQKINP